MSKSLNLLLRALSERTQTPESQPISRNLSSEICPSLYPSILHTSLNLFTAALSILPTDFLSCNIFGRGDVRNCYVRSVSLVCHRNIPQIILPLNVPNSQSQAPSQLTFYVSKKRKAENSARRRRPNWELNQYNTWGSENGEWLPPPEQRWSWNLD